MALEALFSHLPPDEREASLSILRVEIARRRRRSGPPRIIREEKRCPRCQQAKPVTEFGISRSRPDGLQGYCRACR